MVMNKKNFLSFVIIVSMLFSMLSGCSFEKKLSDFSDYQPVYDGMQHRESGKIAGYSRIEGIDGISTFYEINGENPDEWLYVSYSGLMMGGDIVKSSKANDIKLEDADQLAIYNCKESMKIEYDFIISDTVLIDSLFKEFYDDNMISADEIPYEVLYPNGGPTAPVLYNYGIDFIFTRHPGFYYSSSYTEDEQGNGYVLLFGESYFYPVGDLLRPYIDEIIVEK